MQNLPAGSVLAKNRILLFLILIFIFGLFFAGFRIFTTSKQKSDFKVGPFSDQLSQDRYDQLLGSGLGLFAQKPDDLIKAFELLTFEYFRQPSTEKRLALQKLKDYLSKNSPGIEEVKTLTIPCLEQECGYKVDYSAELMALKTETEKNIEIDEPTRQQIIKSLDQVAFDLGQNDKVKSYSTLSGVFYNLKEIYTNDQKEPIKQLALHVLAQMELINPEAYKKAVVNYKI